MKTTTLIIALIIAELGLSQTNTQYFEEDGMSFQYEELNEVKKPIALLVLFNGGAGKASKIIPDGLQKWWHENGQLECEKNYKDGDLISEKCWDEEPTARDIVALASGLAFFVFLMLYGWWINAKEKKIVQVDRHIRLVEALDKLEPIKNKIGNYNEVVEKFWKIANEDDTEDDTEEVFMDLTAPKGDHALDFIDNVALFFNVVEPIKNRIGNYNEVVEKFWKLVEIKTYGNGCWPNFAYIDYALQFIRCIEEFFNEVEPIKNRIGNYNEVVEKFWKLLELETVDNTFDIYAPSSFIKKVLRQDFLTQKYGIELGEKLINNKYFIGMTKEQLIESIGYPATRTKLETKEIYIYRKLYEAKGFTLDTKPTFDEHKRDAFVFVNGELEQIKKDINFYFSKESNSETIKGIVDLKYVESSSGAMSGVAIGWETEADLDVSAFCVGDDGHIVEMTDFVFYGSSNKTVLDGEDFPRPYTSCGGVYGAIDAPDGDEDLWVYFDQISENIKEILVVVTIHDKGVTFSDVSGCYCRIWNPDNENELCRYVMSEDFSNEDAVEIGKFTRDGGVIEIDGEEYPAGEWTFTPIGKGHIGGLSKLISIYAHRYKLNVRKKKDF